MANILGMLFVLTAGDTTTNVSIHKDDVDALVFVDMLPTQFTPQSKDYANKTIFFREDIFKGIIKLVKIYTLQQLGDFL